MCHSARAKTKESGAVWVSRSKTPLLLVGLLRGAIVFWADLMRAIDVPVQPDIRHFQLWGEHRPAAAIEPCFAGMMGGRGSR
jgi:hypoxanthine-guanine phosphoribosyltransferase